MMINDGTMPVLYSAGSLVMYARLVERGTTPPTQMLYPFDPGEAAKDPLGVGSVTPTRFNPDSITILTSGPRWPPLS